MNKNDANPITHGFATIHRLRQARTFAFALTLQNSRNVEEQLRTHPPAGMSPHRGPHLPLRHRDVTTEGHGRMILHPSTAPASAGTHAIGNHHTTHDDRLYRSHQLLWDYARNVNYTAQDCFIHVFNPFSGMNSRFFTDNAFIFTGEHMAGPGLPSVDTLPRHKLSTVNFCNAFSVSVTLLQQYVVPFLMGHINVVIVFIKWAPMMPLPRIVFRDQTLTRLYRRSVVNLYSQRETYAWKSCCGNLLCGARTCIETCVRCLRTTQSHATHPRR